MSFLSDTIFEGVPQLALERIASLQAEDADCVDFKKYLQEEILPANAGRARMVRLMAGEFQVVGDVLYHDVDAQDGRTMLRVVLPSAIVDQLIFICHDRLGHMGWRKTLSALRARVWFEKMREKVRKYIGSCPTCLFNKQRPHTGEMHIPPNGSCPWQVVQVDIVHLHETASGREKAVIFYCRFTRDVEAFAVRGDVSTVTVLNLILYEIIPRHGWMRVLLSDRGSNIISTLAQNFYDAFKVDLRPGDSHMHTVVGGCERFNATLRDLARATHFDTNYHWDAVLPLLVLHYKASIQETTGYSPFYLNHGREPTFPWDINVMPPAGNDSQAAHVRDCVSQVHLAWEITRGQVSRVEQQRKFLHDRKYRQESLAKGNRVLVLQAGRQTKMHMPYVGPFRIAEVLDRDRYRLRDRQGAKHLHHIFHISRLKLFPEGAEGDVELDADYYYVDSILDRRREQDGSYRYLVKWVGFEAASENTWEPIENLNIAAMDEVEEYNLKHPHDSPLEDSPPEAAEPVAADAADSGPAPPSASPPAHAPAAEVEGTARTPSSAPVTNLGPAEPPQGEPLLSRENALRETRRDNRHQARDALNARA